jgi:hypothetical protein
VKVQKDVAVILCNSIGTAKIRLIIVRRISW